MMLTYFSISDFDMWLLLYLENLIYLYIDYFRLLYISVPKEKKILYLYILYGAISCIFYFVHVLVYDVFKNVSVTLYQLHKHIL